MDIFDRKMKRAQLKNIRKSCMKEFDDFLYKNSNKSLCYAYSGGLDSTVALFYLIKKCVKYNVFLHIFTIDNGVKGSITLKNINVMISYLEKNYENFDFEVINIQDDVVDNEIVNKHFDEKLKVKEVYFKCFENDIMPCGKLCNSIMDNAYKEILSKYKSEILLTGGDTPKYSNNRYSVFWHKPSGLNIVRVSIGLGLTKSKNRVIIKRLPFIWKHPMCGGNDTDCLAAGAIMARLFKGRDSVSIEEIKEKNPVMLEYFNERVKMGIISKKDAKKQVDKIDIASMPSYIEFEDLMR